MEPGLYVANESTSVFQRGAELRLNELDLIRAHQANRHVHPLTCGNDSGHRILEGRVILVCLDCDYRQDFLPVSRCESREEPTCPHG